VFILKELKVLCFDTLLQVFILKVDSVAGLAEFSGFGGTPAAARERYWQRGVAVVAGSLMMRGCVAFIFSFLRGYTPVICVNAVDKGDRKRFGVKAVDKGVRGKWRVARKSEVGS